MSDTETAKLLLEHYAHSLESASLLQLSRAHLSLTDMEGLWQRLQSSGASLVRRGGQAAEAEQWCIDFGHQAHASEREAREARDQEATSLPEVTVKRQVLEQEVAASERVLEVFARGAQNITMLLASVQDEAAATAAILEKFRDQIRQRFGGDDVPAEIASAQESLGHAEGLAASGAAEIQDIIRVAIARRADATSKGEASLAQLRSKLSALKQREVALSTGSSTQATASDEDINLRKRYDHLCRWTLDTIKARRR